MPIASEGYPLAAAVSPRVQVVDTTDSTNADVIRHVTEAPEEWPHLSLLLTTDQRAGRGRLDRSWTIYHRSHRPTRVAVSVSALRSETSRFRFPAVGRATRLPARRPALPFGLPRARRS